MKTPAHFLPFAYDFNKSANHPLVSDAQKTARFAAVRYNSIEGLNHVDLVV